MNDPRMAQMFLFHIYLTLTVAMGTENDGQYSLKQTKCHFGPQFGGLTDVDLTLVSAQLNTKNIS